MQEELIKSAQRWTDYHNARADAAEYAVNILSSVLCCYNQAARSAFCYAETQEDFERLLSDIEIDALSALQSAKEAGYV